MQSARDRIAFLLKALQGSSYSPEARDAQDEILRLVDGLPSQFFLITEVHDYEGTFGGLEGVYDTQEEVLQAAQEFKERNSRNDMGCGFTIIEGKILMDER